MHVSVERICRLWVPHVGARLGVVAHDRVYDLTAVNRALFGSMADLLAAADAGTFPAKGASLEVSGPGWALADLDVAPAPTVPHLLAPVDTQEIWAAGVTYLRSREARREESAQGGDFYSLVYDADRPELFFKATPSRCVGPGDEIVIRKDSEWNVPEPELALVLTPAGKVFGYTVGNDVSSRSIEGANPLYLPQAKVYKGACALGPVVTVASAIPNPRELPIRLTIRRGDALAYRGATSTSQMRRTFEDLVKYLMRENEFPAGVFLLTGTGLVPETPFTLQAGDVVEIGIEGIGSLRNRVRLGRG